jgi:ABC-2 type transport system permease protein
VRKIEFPRLVVPLAVILIAYFNLVLNLLAVLVFVLATGVDPRLEWLALPLLLLPLGLFAGGLAMLLSALYVRFRDVRPIWEVMLQVIFYGSPILYVLDQLPSESLQHLVIWFNPLATILAQSRHTLIDENAPNSWDAAGGFEYLFIPGAIVVGLFALGFWVFNREAPRIAEEL